MTLKTELFRHQKNAFEYVKDKNFFALYMDMGTGKTRTIIEYIKQKDVKKIIYFCPVCLKATVKVELKKHIFNPSFEIESGQKKLSEDKQFYVIGIESINSKRVYFAVRNLIENIENYLVVVDESTYIKSFHAKRSNRIIDLSRNAKYRVVMTGTPITQYYQDIFMQFKFLDPGIIPYRSYFGFCNRYLKFHDDYKNFIIGTKNIDELMGFINPHIYQVKKSDCVDLPDKIFKEYYFEMPVDKRKEYEDLKHEYLSKIDVEVMRERYYAVSTIIFEMFSALQKVVSTCYVEKYIFLKEIIRSSDKVCIYCKYIKEVDFLKDKLDGFMVYTGAQSQKERAEIIENLSDHKGLIMTYGVGSFGLNLTQITNCVFFSSNFNFADRKQAEDRFHRIGQDEDVIYHKFICSDSIDSLINNNLYTKGSLLKDFNEVIKALKNENKC